MIRKVFCNVLDGAVYEDRCLFKLSKVIEGNKSCESCVLRELERLRCPEIKEDETKRKKVKRRRKRKSVLAATGSRDAKKNRKYVKGVKDAKATKASSDIKGPEDVESYYSAQELAELLGKAKRTVQDLAKKGKIPGQKIGLCWTFRKTEIEDWLSKRRTHADPERTISPQCQCHDDDPTMERPIEDNLPDLSIPAKTETGQGEDLSSAKPGDEESGQTQEPEMPAKKEAV